MIFIFSLFSVTLSFSEPDLRKRVENIRRRKIKSAKPAFLPKTFQHHQKYFTHDLKSWKRKSSSAPTLNFEVNSKSEESGSFHSLKNDSIQESIISVNLSGEISDESEINEPIEVTENEKCYSNNKNNEDWDTSIPCRSKENIKEKSTHKRTVKQIFSHLLCSSFNE